MVLRSQRCSRATAGRWPALLLFQLKFNMPRWNHQLFPKTECGNQEVLGSARFRHSFHPKESSSLERFFLNVRGEEEHYGQGQETLLYAHVKEWWHLTRVHYIPTELLPVLRSGSVTGVAQLNELRNTTM